jgi:membrane protein
MEYLCRALAVRALPSTAEREGHGPMELWERIKLVALAWLWGLPGTHRWAAGAAMARAVRIACAVAGDLADGRLTNRAASLVYTTLLSIVPALAVGFSALRAFEVHHQAEPLLLAVLEPLGERGEEIVERLIGFVDGVQAGALGSVGLLLLLFTVLALVHKIETALNDTWQVSRPRRIDLRIMAYLSVVLVGPVLVFSAVGIAATVMASGPVRGFIELPMLGTAVELVGRVVPYLLVAAAFAFVYVYIPNTRVRLRSALVGAAVAAALWASVGWGFASLVVGSTRLAAIYSGLAIIVFFMLWLYLAWLVVLVGASVAFYHQHPEYLDLPTRKLRLSNRVKERLGLAMLCLIARSHLRGEPPWTTVALARRLEAPLAPIEALLEALAAAGLMTRAEGNRPTYLPAREVRSIAVKEVLDAIRAVDETRLLADHRVAPVAPVDALLADLDGKMAQALAGISLGTLAASEPEAAGEAVPGDAEGIPGPPAQTSADTPAGDPPVRAPEGRVTGLGRPPRNARRG